METWPIGTGIQQCTDSHVAADAGKRVEITDFQWIEPGTSLQRPDFAGVRLQHSPGSNDIAKSVINGCR